MAEVAAHLTDEVVPHLPVRQWVLPVPKRLRPFLHQSPEVASAVLGIFLRALRSALRDASPGAPTAVRDAQLGAISFPQRFGSSLPSKTLSAAGAKHPHYHYHVLALDGVVSGDVERGVRVHEASRLQAPDAKALARSRMLWAQLLARIYEVLPLLCPVCGGEMKVISFITLPSTVERILLHLDLPHRPPRVSPARGPPQAELHLDQTPAFDLAAPEPIPELPSLRSGDPAGYLFCSSSRGSARTGSSSISPRPMTGRASSTSASPAFQRLPGSRPPPPSQTLRHLARPDATPHLASAPRGRLDVLLWGKPSRHTSATRRPISF
jgi:hypothetical protein